MKHAIRITLALAFVGLVATAAVAFGQQSTPTAEDKPVRPRLQKFREQRAERIAKVRGRHSGFGRRMVTGEFKVQTDNGFATVRTDNGTVTSVAGNTLTLKRADGETVTVTVTDDTTIRKDRKSVELSVLEAGDVVHVTRVDDGDGLVVRSVRAHSPDTTKGR